MFGLEKGKGKSKPFEFDLEKQLRGSGQEKKRILNQIESQVNQLKQALREGTSSESFDQYGILLQAYAALKRVVMRTTRR